MNDHTVIFDLDGTLLNTLEDLADATNYALGQYGYPRRTLEEVRGFVGNGARKLIERALPQGAQRKDADEVLAVFRQYYNAHCQEKTCAYEGVMELMGQLKSAGYQMAVVSNKPDSAVKNLCRTYFADYIQAAIGERDGVRRKPAPDMVEQALAQLGSSKTGAVYVGDSDVDIQTAANTGLFCISVAWGFRDERFLWENGASAIAHTPSEVLKIIRSNETHTG